MELVLVKSIYRNTEKFADRDVKVSGWIRTVRDSKSFGFIELNDGTFFKNVQIVFDDTLDNFKEISKLPISSSILVEGKVVITSNASAIVSADNCPLTVRFVSFPKKSFE